MGYKYSKKDSAWINYRGATKIINHHMNLLKYDSSWDWLMPVVEKIEDLGFIVEIESKYCGIRQCDSFSGNETIIVKLIEGSTKKKAIYKAVIEFIKWYNKNGKS